MRNDLDMYACTPFSLIGSCEDKRVKAWGDDMSKAGAERPFLNLTTVASVF